MARSALRAVEDEPSGDAPQQSSAPQNKGPREADASVKPILTAQALRRAAREHARAAIQALAKIASGDESPAVRVSAANAILDRAFGKPRAEAGAGEGGKGERTAPRPKIERRIDNVIVYPPEDGWDHWDDA